MFRKIYICLRAPSSYSVKPKEVCKEFDLDFEQFSIVFNVFREDNSMNAFVFLPNDSV